MMKKLLAIASRVFEKIFILHEAVVDYQCSLNVTLGKDSHFYKSASVHNFQHKRNKIRIGSNSHIRGELLIFPYGGEIQIGDTCYLGEGTRIWSGEQVIIGNNVAIAHNVNIVDSAHETDHLERAAGISQILENGHPVEKGNIPTAPIVIEDYVAIYPNVSILRGVTIGKGAIISAGSVIMTDVPPFTLMLGNPARPMKKLNN